MHDAVVCTCVFENNHIVTYCGCAGPRRPPVNLYDGHREAWTLKRDAPVCSCTPWNKKHASGYECIKPEVLAIWTALHPGPAAILSERSQKRLAWMWLCWSQDEEAKRLSGRA